MTTTPKICRMTGQEIKLHTINMLDNCDAIETIRMEISTEHLVAKLMAMANSADGGEADSASSVSSESNSKFSSVPSSDSSFFNTFVKRLTVFSLKAISLVRKEGCQNETYSNLMLVFDIFTVTLRLARQNSQSQILKDLQHLMNSNMAGHLIVEVISLAHSGGVGNTGTLKLVDYALKFSSEFLFNGNRQCQKSLLKQFFFLHHAVPEVLHRGDQVDDILQKWYQRGGYGGYHRLRVVQRAISRHTCPGAGYFCPVTKFVRRSLFGHAGMLRKCRAWVCN